MAQLKRCSKIPPEMMGKFMKEGKPVKYLHCDLRLKLRNFQELVNRAFPILVVGWVSQLPLTSFSLRQI